MKKKCGIDLGGEGRNFLSRIRFIAWVCAEVISVK